MDAMEAMRREDREQVAGLEQELQRIRWQLDEGLLRTVPSERQNSLRTLLVAAEKAADDLRRELGGR